MYRVLWVYSELQRFDGLTGAVYSYDCNVMRAVYLLA